MISVFTPSHDSTYLDQAYKSLKAQTFKDWEWIVLLNGQADSSWEKPDDPRVVTAWLHYVDGVGQAKREAVSLCKGEILLELDHDDILERNCLSEVHRAVKDHPEASLVYSQFTQVDDKGGADLEQFRSDYGWKYEEHGKTFISPVSLDPTPHNVSLIWFAPNHVRAFTRQAYDKTRGYDPDRKVLDDQDLMSQLYQVGEFISIPKVLYRQRIHAGNTQKHAETNSQIQEQTWDLYERYLADNVEAWRKRKGLLSTHEMKSPYSLQQFPPSSLGGVRAVDILNQADDPGFLMDQIHRSLAPNGLLMTLTPSTDGRGAFAHPPAKSFWNEFSFSRYTTGSEAKFQVSRLRTLHPSPWHEQNDISYVQANLIAVKEGYVRDGGPLANVNYNW